MNQKFFAYQCDISEYSSLSKVIQNIDSVDVIINNAGIAVDGFLEEIPVEKIVQAININLLGVIYATQLVLGAMKTRNSGIILNISSVAGLIGSETKAKRTVYSASKFGVTGFTEALKAELKNTNIKVLGFYPGGIETDLFKKIGLERSSQKRYMPAPSVANLVIEMLEKTDIFDGSRSYK